MLPRELPRELVLAILAAADLTIDQRRGLGIAPGKLRVPRATAALLESVHRPRLYRWRDDGVHSVVHFRRQDHNGPLVYIYCYHRSHQLNETAGDTLRMHVHSTSGAHTIIDVWTGAVIWRRDDDHRVVVPKKKGCCIM